MKVAVVGGGVAGLTAAWRLLGAGHEPIVLEAGPRAGGVIQTSTVDGFVREHAANGFLTGDDDGAAALCAELGVPVVEAAAAAKHRWIYRGGELHPVPASPVAFARSRLLTWRGKLAALGEPLRPGRDAAVAGDESMRDFATRRFGAEAAAALIGPVVTGVYAADAADISLAAGFPKLAELDAAGGMVRGMLAKRRGGAKRPRPRLAAPLGGMGAIPAALAARLGDRVRLDAPVARVVPTADGVTLDGPGGGRFDAVVLAVPAPAARALVADAIPALAAALTSAVAAPAAVVYLGFDAGVVPPDRDGFGLLVCAGEAVRVLGVVFESTIYPGRAPAGARLFRMIYGGGRDPAAAALDDAALLAQARGDLARVLGVTANPRHASIVRWQAALAQYRVGHLDRAAQWDALARPHRVVLCGAPYHGVAVNACIADGRRAAAAVAALA
ncbi:MAG: protoporphyrinogen oxidase [Kofleriaceae bacterium]